MIFSWYYTEKAQRPADYLPFAVLKWKVQCRIREHEEVKRFCSAYGMVVGWGATILAAVTTALSSQTLATSGAPNQETQQHVSIALVALTSLTTMLTFWSNYSKFTVQVHRHGQAIKE